MKTVFKNFAHWLKQIWHRARNQKDPNRTFESTEAPSLSSSTNETRQLDDPGIPEGELPEVIDTSSNEGANIRQAQHSININEAVHETSNEYKVFCCFSNENDGEFLVWRTGKEMLARHQLSFPQQEKDTDKADEITNKEPTP